jgi:hypothetical protein
VFSYLVHNCYKEAANAFLSTAGMKNPIEPMLDMDSRKCKLLIFCYKVIC